MKKFRHSISEPMISMKYFTRNLVVLVFLMLTNSFLVAQKTPINPLDQSRNKSFPNSNPQINNNASTFIGRAVEYREVWQFNQSGSVWLTNTTVTRDGVDAAQSGAIGDGEATFIQTEVTGPGTMFFNWKVSSEKNYDFLVVRVLDNFELVSGKSISGEVDWHAESITVPSGTYTVQFSYEKDGSASVGDDLGWLDAVSFVPEAELNLDFSGAQSISQSSVEFANKLVSGDFNSDGFKDVAVFGPVGARVVLYINDGEQSYTTFEIPIEVGQISLMKASDFDLDGDLDIVYTTAFEDHLAILVNENAGESFSNLVLQASSGGQIKNSDIEIVDLDRDGSMEIAVADETNGEVVFYKEDGSGGFDRNVITSSRIGVNSIDFKDITSNGYPDVLFSFSSGVMILENEGILSDDNLSFIDGNSYVETGIQVEFVDLDRNGETDVLLFNPNAFESLIWYPTISGSTFKVVLGNELTTGSSFRIEDLNGDSWPEIVLLSADNIAVYSSNKSSDALSTTYSPQSLISTTNYDYGDIAVIDLDGDSDKDILFPSENDGLVSVLYNDIIDIPASLLLDLPASNNSFDDQSSYALLNFESEVPNFVLDRFDNPSEAYLFNGVAQNLYFQDFNNSNFGEEFTVSFWHKTDVIARDQAIISTEWLSIYSGFNGIVYAEVDTENGFMQAGSDTAFTLGEWHYVVLRNDGDNLELFVDDRLQSSTPSLGAVSPGQTGMYIGRPFSIGSDNRFFDGHLDDIFITREYVSNQDITDEFFDGGWRRGITISGTVTDGISDDFAMNSYPNGDDLYWVGTLSSGDLTFTQESGIVFGDNESDGTADDGGTAITLAEGQYGITFDTEDLTYNVERIESFGIIGSALTGDESGWNAEDVVMTHLSGSGIYTADWVEFYEGQFKFRANSAWETDFGLTSTGNVNVDLEFRGDNIPVSEGVYSIALDIINKTYSIDRVLLAEYSFSGNTLDESGNGLDLTPVGSPTPTSDRFGVDNSAYRLNGTTDFFDIQNQDLVGGLSNASISAWIKLNALPTTLGELFRSDESTIRINDNGSFAWIIWGDGGNFSVSTQNVYTLPIDEWTHIATTFEDGNVKLYVNGSVIIEQSIGEQQIFDVPNSVLSIGGDPNSSFFLPADIDDIAIFAATLTQEDVTALYTDGEVPRPSEAAAIPPAREAIDVISVFGESYSNLTGTDFSPNWGQSTQVNSVTITDNPTLRYTDFNYQGIQFETAVDASAMGTIHFDLWTTDATTVNFSLISTGPVEKAYPLTISAGQWVNYQIPASFFDNVNLSDVIQLKFDGGEGTETIYLDNLYFSTDQPVIAAPSVAATAPTQDAANVISVFSDSYTDVGVDTYKTSWSQAVLEEVIISGSAMKKYSNLDFVGIESTTQPIDISSNITHFRVDIWSPDFTQFRIKLVDFGADASFGGGDDTEHEITYESPIQGEWVSYDIPLSDFTNLATRSNIAQIIFSAVPSGTSTVFVDNIYFYGQEDSSPPITGPVNPVDFELAGNGADFTWSVFENGPNNSLDIIDNPDPSGINTSSKVARFVASPDGQSFAGVTTEGFGTFLLDQNNSTVKMMVWKPVISDVGFKLESSTGWSGGEILVANTKVNEWEELTFDFSNSMNPPELEGEVFSLVAIFPDFDTNGRTQENTIYIDNITFSPTENSSSDEAPVVAATAPTVAPSDVISLFSDSYSDVTVDTWRAEWSNATFEDVVIDGSNVKKYSDFNLVGVEMITQQLNISQGITNFSVDVWSADFTQFEVTLVDFGPDGTFNGGDDVEHKVIFETPTQREWVTFDIPISDFTSLTTKSNIAQVVFSGLPAGSSTVYVDNVFFYRDNTIPPPIVESVSTNKGTPGEQVFILGQGFSPNPQENIVYFGTTAAIPSAATSTELTVSVPKGAETNSLSLINVQSGLRAEVLDEFIVINAESPGDSWQGTLNVPNSSTTMTLLEVADFNGDGAPDIIIGDRLGRNVDIYSNSGSFDLGVGFDMDFDTYELNLAQGYQITDIHATDLNSDGHTDLIIAASAFGSGQMLFLENLGEEEPIVSLNSFSLAFSLSTLSNIVGINSRDFNGDGYLDLVWLSRDNDALMVAINSGTNVIDDEMFLTESGFQTLNAPHDLEIADVDDDGLLDFIVSHAGASSIYIFRNATDENKSFDIDVNQTIQSSIFQPQIEVGDLNSDGLPEIIVNGNVSTSFFQVWENQLSSDGFNVQIYPSPVNFAPGSGPLFSKVADITGDGFLDILTTVNGQGFLDILVNGAVAGEITDASFTATTALGVSPSPRDVRVTDLNGDNLMDIIVVSESQFEEFNIILARPSTARLDISQASITVPSTTLGNQTTETLTIFNDGGAESLTGSISFAVGGIFSVSAETLDVAPIGEFDVVITSTNNTVGTLRDTLIISTNDAINPEIRVPLQVSVVDPSSAIAGLISDTRVWTKAQSPYFINGSTRITSTGNLTVEAGVEILIDSGVQFLVDGVMEIQGSVDDSVRINSAVSTPYRNIQLSNGGRLTANYLSVANADTAFFFDQNAVLELNNTSIFDATIGLVINEFDGSNNNFTTLSNVVISRVDFGAVFLAVDLEIDGLEIRNAGTGIEIELYGGPQNLVFDWKNITLSNVDDGIHSNSNVTDNASIRDIKLTNLVIDGVTNDAINIQRDEFTFRAIQDWEIVNSRISDATNGIVVSRSVTGLSTDNVTFTNLSGNAIMLSHAPVEMTIENSTFISGGTALWYGVDINAFDPNTNELVFLNNKVSDFTNVVHATTQMEEIMIKSNIFDANDYVFFTDDSNNGQFSYSIGFYDNIVKNSGVVGLNGRFTQFLAANNQFENNPIAIDLMQNSSEIRYNTFLENDVAIKTSADNNDFPTIQNNNFINSVTYHIQLSGVDDDLSAPNNYWGSTEISEIRSFIFDGNFSGSGLLYGVNIEPILTSPVGIGNAFNLAVSREAGNRFKLSWAEQGRATKYLIGYFLDGEPVSLGNSPIEVAAPANSFIVQIPDGNYRLAIQGIGSINDSTEIVATQAVFSDGTAPSLLSFEANQNESSIRLAFDERIAGSSLDPTKWNLSGDAVSISDIFSESDVEFVSLPSNSGDRLTDGLLNARDISTVGGISVETNPSTTMSISAADVNSSVISMDYVDFDGDGITDVITTMDSNNGTDFFGRFFRNNGSNQVPNYLLVDNGFQAFASGSSFGSMSLADLDGDGNKDLIVGTWDRGIRYFKAFGEYRSDWNFNYDYNNSRADLKSESGAVLDRIAYRHFVDLPDLNGDGLPEIVAGVGYPSEFVIMYENQGVSATDGYARFAAPVLQFLPIPSETEEFWHNEVRFVDADGDGDLDAFLRTDRSPTPDFNYDEVVHAFYYYENTGTVTSPEFLSAVEMDMSAIYTDFFLRAWTVFDADGNAGETNDIIVQLDADLNRETNYTLSTSSISDVFGNLGSVSETFYPEDGNANPTVAITANFSGEQRGEIPISYTLADPEFDNSTVRVRYSNDKGQTWKIPASQSDTTGLTPGNKVFVWDSFADEAGNEIDSVWFSFQPYDFTLLDLGSTQFIRNLRVDNNFEPLVVVDTLTGTLRSTGAFNGDIDISHLTSDVERDNVLISATYIGEGENDVVKIATTNPLSGTSFNADSTLRNLVWSSTTDLPDTAGYFNVTLLVADTDTVYSESQRVLIDNKGVTIAQFVSPADFTVPVADTIMIVYDVKSPTVSDVTMQFEYFINDTWNVATTTNNSILNLINIEQAQDTLYWLSKADLPESFDGVLPVRITPIQSGEEGLFAQGDLRVKNNEAPTINLLNASQTNLLVPVQFTIEDPEQDDLTIALEYSTDNGENWFAATLTSNSVTVYVGINANGTKTITWSSDEDLPLFDSQVLLRMSVRDTGEPVYSNEITFNLDNEFAPQLVSISPEDNGLLLHTGWLDIEFSAPMNELTRAGIQMSGRRSGTRTTVIRSSNGNNWSIRPQTNFEALDTITVTIRGAVLEDQNGVGFDGNGNGDPDGNVDDRVFTFVTTSLADITDADGGLPDGEVLAEDVNNFITRYTSDNTEIEFGPVVGTLPFFRVTDDNVMDFEDLIGYATSWSWFRQNNVSLSTLGEELLASVQKSESGVQTNAKVGAESRNDDAEPSLRGNFDRVRSKATSMTREEWFENIPEMARYKAAPEEGQGAYVEIKQEEARSVYQDAQGNYSLSNTKEIHLMSWFDDTLNVVEAIVKYDPTQVEIASINNRNFFENDGGQSFFLSHNDTINGLAVITVGNLSKNRGTSAFDTLATLSFNVLDSKESSLWLGYSVIAQSGKSSKAITETSFVTENQLPEDFALLQNFPNPFNPTTTLRYHIPEQSNVKLMVFDVLGRQVATLVDRSQTAGFYQQTWDASRAASGIYLYVLVAQTEQGKMVRQVQKMTLVK